MDAQWLTFITKTGETGDEHKVRSAELLTRGIEEFNRGRFRASHETWEALWVDSAYPQRLFLLALTKLGAGFAHALRRNETGVHRLLEDAVRFIRPFGPTYAGVDVQRTTDDVRQWLASTKHLGFEPPFPQLSTVNHNQQPNA